MWHATREGSRVQIVSDSGQKIATVGDEHDHRINHHMTNAKLMASAPEMLEVLIDIQELFRREFFVDDHPILESIYQKCNELIDRSFDRREHNVKILRTSLYQSKRPSGGLHAPTDHAGCTTGSHSLSDNRDTGGTPSPQL